MSKSYIGLLDCNNFFVSCERLFRPDLNNKPVLVLSGNDGCVVARSQEIKDIGIPMGVPYFKIKDMVKKHDITTFSSNFSLYRDISRRVISLMSQELEMVEQYSIDEAFFTLSDNIDNQALKLKALVETQIGIPVSVGVARTKTQAKYASKLAKNSSCGVSILQDSDWNELLKDLELGKIWGVGGQTVSHFKQYGLTSVADFIALEKPQVQKIFGVKGLHLQAELIGQSIEGVLNKIEVKQSLTSSRSFPQVSSDKAIVMDAIAFHVRQVAKDLRKYNLETKSIRVSILPSRHGDFGFYGGSLEAILPVSTANSITLMKVASELVDRLFEVNIPYKKAGVTVVGLVSGEVKQAHLFPEQQVEKTNVLMKIIDHLNQSTGREVVMIGSHLREQKWRSRTDMLSPAYTTKWTDLATAKTN